MPPSPKKPRKSKPKFELPEDTESPNAPVGWVYRADEALATVIPIDSAPAEKPAIPHVPAAASAEPTPVEARSYSHPLVIVGTGVFFLGAGTVGVVSLIGLALVATPLKAARTLLGSARSVFS